MTEPASVPAIPDDIVALEGGGRMPLLGFGSWQLKRDEAVKATSAALEAGYRHVDTATVYGNEAEVGRALHDSGLARGDVFVTTKCPPKLVGQELDTLRRSLDLLGSDYVDLWLIHWPTDTATSLQMWGAFIEARESGLARDIGVSNFGVDMIDDVTSATGRTPAVNQIEWSPLLFDAQVIEGHRARSVALEGYSALRGGSLEHPTIVRIAQSAGRTPAQVIIRWHLQHGVIVIPKSREADRIRVNADVAGFQLSDADMAALDGLGRAS